MACYHPIRAFRTPEGVVFSQLRRHDIIGSIDLPCGQCIGCRQRRAMEWATRITHEAQLHDASCFVTLTYGRDKLPPFGSLCYADFQGFMKRAREHFARCQRAARLRFFMCGEYGPKNLRPHYHACLFGVDFRDDRIEAGRSGAGEVFYDSPLLSSLWTHGLVSVQDLNQSTAAYCAKYICAKVVGDRAEAHYQVVDADGVIIGKRTPEFCRCSLKPGIGARWFEKYGTDVYPHDYVVVDGGRKLSAPRYYDKLVKRAKYARFDEVEYARQKRAILCAADSTDERLAVREVVHAARIRNQKRELE